MKSYIKDLCAIVSGFDTIDSGADATLPFAPEVVLYPETVKEISQAMRYLSAKNIEVFPFCGSTKLFLGNPVCATVGLSLSRFSGVLSHDVSDMVSTVRCGTQISEFQRTIGQKRQIFPVDPPFLDSGATIGGIVSSNLCGPLSTRYGTCKELVLGVKAVRADGEIISVGGKVVKNVAGYDIAKLLVGSLGTLCVLAEVTFRLYPQEQSSQTLALLFTDAASCSRATRKVLDADVVPTCVEVLDEKLSRRLWPKSNIFRVILIRFDSLEQAAMEQKVRIKADVLDDAAEIVDQIDESRSVEIWKAVREFPFDQKVDLIARIALPIRNSIEVMESIGHTPELSGVELNCVLRPARGVILAEIKGDRSSVLRVARYLENLVTSLSGSIMFSAFSARFLREVKPWWNFGNSFEIMKNIKNRFDPHNILCPGKMFKSGGVKREGS